MPHIKSNIDLEKSFGKFSTSYLSESKRLEMKIQRDAKICQILLIGIISILAIVFVWNAIGIYSIIHFNGKL